MDDETVTYCCFALSLLRASTPNLYVDKPRHWVQWLHAGRRVGLSNEGGSNSKWEVSKGRLGNENDLYGEFGFKKEVYAEDDVSFLVDSMLSYQGQDENAADKSVDVVQLNVQAVGLFEDKDIGIWAVSATTNAKDVRHCW